jgi:hypothetical protein
MKLEQDPEEWVPVFGKRSCSNMKLEHDPEKWGPVFGKRSCSNMKLEPDDDSTKNHPALADAAHVYRGRRNGCQSENGARFVR